MYIYIYVKLLEKNSTSIIWVFDDSISNDHGFFWYKPISHLCCQDPQAHAPASQPTLTSTTIYQKTYVINRFVLDGVRDFLQETIIFHVFFFSFPCRFSIKSITRIHRPSLIGLPSQLESLLDCLHLGIRSWVSSFSGTPNYLVTCPIDFFSPFSDTPNYMIKFLMPANIPQPCINMY